MSDDVIDYEGEVEEVPGRQLARTEASMMVKGELTVDDLVAQVNLIQQAMQRVMKQDEHYGVIPGTGSKPSLFKPGAEKLLVLFRLAPDYEVEKVWHADGHLTAMAVCRLRHIPTGSLVGSAEGLCTTRESRYAYRNADRLCPVCGKAAIIKGKEEYGGGWVCFKRKDGCGAKFRDDDPAILGQQAGKVDNPDLADSYNTVIKMAQKRALVAAVLNATAASDFFTQDVEDLTPGGGHAQPATAPAAEREAESLANALEADLTVLEAAGVAGWSRAEILAHVGSIEGRTFSSVHELPIAALRDLAAAARPLAREKQAAAL